MNLAIIIPARNEEGNIQDVLRNIPVNIAQQIIVVDNGSTDRTAARARELHATVVSESRLGYGQACLTGVNCLREEIDAVAILDGDGSENPSNLIQMLALIENDEADFVLSARVLGDARSNLSVQQRFGNWLAVSLIGLMWRYRYTEMGPLRVISRKAFEQLEMKDPTWGWNVEMQIKAIWKKLRVREIPVSYGRRLTGKSKISGTLMGTIRAGAKILKTIGQLWITLPRTAPAAKTDGCHKAVCVDAC